MTRQQGRRACLFMDSKGLVCSARTDLQHHKRPFAHDVPPCRTLLEAIQQVGCAVCRLLCCQVFDLSLCTHNPARCRVWLALRIQSSGSSSSSSAHALPAQLMLSGNVRLPTHTLNTCLLPRRPLSPCR